MITMMQIWFVTRVFLYERYDTVDPFMPQFEENAGIVINMLDDVPRLKELFKDAGRP